MPIPTRHFTRALPYICASCARSQFIVKSTLSSQTRSISQNWLRKTAEAADQWAIWAGEILAGKRKSMLEILEERGYVHQVVGPRDELNLLMTYKRVGAYVGIDPTAGSMHVGHLVPLMSLFWLYIHGCHSISLLGGVTAKFGDPVGRLASREKLHSSERKANMASMHMQLKGLWANVERYARRYNYRYEWVWHRGLVNNNTWLHKLGVAELMSLLGDGIRVGTMLRRETVRNKMTAGDGLSLNEFLYPVLQSMDWWHMYQTMGIQVQIGGSDQFGNIAAGIEAIKYIAKNHVDPDYRQIKQTRLNTPMGFTVPLLTTSSGEKFGKSAGNAIWLDKDRTSTFDLYQFFLRTTDADVERYLKLFTFMPMEQIESIMTEHNSQPSLRIAQRKLAFDVLDLVHGEELAQDAAQQHDLVFKSPRTPVPKPAIESGDKPQDMSSLLNPKAPITTPNNAPSPHMLLPKSLVYNTPVARILYSAGLVASRSEGHRLVAKKGAYVGSRPGASGTMGDQLEFTPAHNWFVTDTEKYIIDGGLLIVRVGKWKVKIIKIVSDEEFERLGLTVPGWKEEMEPEPTEVTRSSEPWERAMAKAPMHKKLVHYVPVK